jgi:phytoene dehydrogenase-like protein
VRYDAAIIGAGADGLAAAATLAKSGLKTIVIERGEHPGGRCTTREFHPGFHASPFCDELAPIPAEIFWALDLARRGVIFEPAALSTALWPDRSDKLSFADPLLAEAAALAKAVLRRAEQDASPKQKFFSRQLSTAWPGAVWTADSLLGLLAAKNGCGDRAAHLMARALVGRAAHPSLAGSAVHLIAPGVGGGGMVAQGLHRLTDALVVAAQEAGAEIACGIEVFDIRRTNGNIAGVRLADGTDIAAKAVLSTLDAKRTFLSLFAWKDLPSEISQRCAAFRMAGSTARLLFALDHMPDIPAHDGKEMFSGPIYLTPDAADFSHAYASWREGMIAKRLPVALRFPSVLDPSLCPRGAAVMTATIGCVPARLFDGSWTREKRDALRAAVLATIEEVFPGLHMRVVATELIVPPDIEETLGLTDGDLWGGEIAPDQMFDLRPWNESGGPRTAIKGVYLAGPSSAAGPHGTCAAGVIAARAIMADLGRLP